VKERAFSLLSVNTCAWATAVTNEAAYNALAAGSTSPRSLSGNRRPGTPR